MLIPVFSRVKPAFPLVKAPVKALMKPIRVFIRSVWLKWYPRVLVVIGKDNGSFSAR